MSDYELSLVHESRITNKIENFLLILARTKKLSSKNYMILNHPVGNVSFSYDPNRSENRKKCQKNYSHFQLSTSLPPQQVIVSTATACLVPFCLTVGAAGPPEGLGPLNGTSYALLPRKPVRSCHEPRYENGLARTSPPQSRKTWLVMVTRQRKEKYLVDPKRGFQCQWINLIPICI